MTNLKPLGKALFYLYITLSLLGCLGIVFGSIASVLKLMRINEMVFTPWWEIVALIMISWGMMKLFIREGIDMLDSKWPEQKIKNEKIANEVFIENSNVISFAKTRNKYN
jgi:hypothetical protein